MRWLSNARWAAFAALVFLSLIPASFAGDKTLMHCFAWTPVKEATPADWEAFYKASDDLPHKIKGILRVWYGKLATPLPQAQLGNIGGEVFQKYQAGETINAPVTRTPREYGMCMEMKDAAVLKAYDTDPYHKVWTEAYSKIRVDGTTTFNILGQ
jgi:hypothetical protein